jgi:signal transduction histidine kinase
MAERLQHSHSALAGKNAELDSFVYSVSHDLKAPLVTIQGMAGVLLEDFAPQLPPQGRHYVERIQANTQQMEHLIFDLLALSRIGREAHAPQPVHLAELIDEVLAGFAEPIGARGIKVSQRALGTLWAIRIQLEQVFGNLLGNAIKYLGDTPAPAVEIGSADRGAFVECYVTDNGIGIDPAYHDKIFEIFQRLKEVEAPGTGVGLAIVKKIVDGAGGRIWVESAPGRGATFRFTWPKPPREERS